MLEAVNTVYIFKYWCVYKRRNYSGAAYRHDYCKAISFCGVRNELAVNRSSKIKTPLLRFLQKQYLKLYFLLMNDSTYICPRIVFFNLIDSSRTLPTEYFQWWAFRQTILSESQSLRLAHCLYLFFKYMHRQKEKCVLKQMCAYKTMNYNVLSLHTSFFTLFHPYQSNDNVNTKQTCFKWRASGFSFVKKLLQYLLH